MKAIARLLFTLLPACALVWALPSFAQQPPPSEVPPPPGLDEPGVATPPAATQPQGEQSTPRDDDPLAPLPKPDSRLARDKASRDAARAAASEMTRRTQGEDTIEEYRQNGRIWMIKIRHPSGPVQTFYANDGSGRLQRDPREGPVSPVYFTLYEWK